MLSGARASVIAMVGRRKKRQRNGRQNLPSVIRKPMHRPYVCRDDDVAELPIRRIHAAQSGALGGRAWNGPHDHDAVNAPLRRQCFVAGHDADARRRHPAVTNEHGTTRLTTSTGMAKPMPALDPAELPTKMGALPKLPTRFPEDSINF